MTNSSVEPNTADAIEVAADAVLMMRAAAVAGLDAEGVASAVGAYGPHLEAVASRVGARVAEQMNADMDLSTILNLTAAGITSGVGMYTAGAVILAALLLEEVMRATGREAGEVVAEVLERTTRG